MERVRGSGRDGRSGREFWQSGRDGRKREWHEFRRRRQGPLGFAAFLFLVVTAAIVARVD